MTDKSNRSLRAKYFDMLLNYVGASKQLDTILERVEADLTRRGLQHKALDPYDKYVVVEGQAYPAPPDPITPVIENQAQRLVLKAQDLKIPMPIHADLLMMFGADPLESLYDDARVEAATAIEKSLSIPEELTLIDQRAAAVGLPSAVATVISRRFGLETLKRTVEQLGARRMFNFKSLPSRGAKAPTIEIDPLFKVQVIKWRN